jgi:hypothetical protein
MTGQEEYEVTYCTYNKYIIGRKILKYSTTTTTTTITTTATTTTTTKTKRKILQLKQCVTFIEYIKYSLLMSITRNPER